MPGYPRERLMEFYALTESWFMEELMEKQKEDLRRWEKMMIIFFTIGVTFLYSIGLMYLVFYIPRLGDPLMIIIWIVLLICRPPVRRRKRLRCLWRRLLLWRCDLPESDGRARRRRPVEVLRQEG